MEYSLDLLHQKPQLLHRSQKQQLREAATSTRPITAPTPPGRRPLSRAAVTPEAVPAPFRHFSKSARRCKTSRAELREVDVQQKINRGMGVRARAPWRARVRAPQPPKRRRWPGTGAPLACVQARARARDAAALLPCAEGMSRCAAWSCPALASTARTGHGLGPTCLGGRLSRTLRACALSLSLSCVRVRILQVLVDWVRDNDDLCRIFMFKRLVEKAEQAALRSVCEQLNQGIRLAANYKGERCDIVSMLPKHLAKHIFSYIDYDSVESMTSVSKVRPSDKSQLI